MGERYDILFVRRGKHVNYRCCLRGEPAGRKRVLILWRVDRDVAVAGGAGATAYGVHELCARVAQFGAG